MRVVAVAPWAGSSARLLPDFVGVVSSFDEVVLVDDGCDEETAKGLQQEVTRRRDWRLAKTDAPRSGYAVACNRGFAGVTPGAPDDVLVFLNSDVRAPRSGLAGAVRTGIGVGSLYGPEISYMIVFGISFVYVVGWCIAARRGTWARLVVPPNEGPWDAAYRGLYWEDNDLSLRAQLADLSLVQTDWTAAGFVAHKQGQTTGPPFRRGEDYERNRCVFAARVRPLWQRMMDDAGGDS